MTLTPELIRGFHRALHVACGFPALNPSMSDDLRWKTFLFELKPLEDDPDAGGPITVADIQAVVGEMKRQNKANEARWSLRPGKILQEPEAFRDMILITRSKRRADRPRPPHFVETTQMVGDITRRVDLPAVDPDEVADFSAACRALHEKIGARRPAPKN